MSYPLHVLYKGDLPRTLLSVVAAGTGTRLPAPAMPPTPSRVVLLGRSVDHHRAGNVGNEVGRNGSQEELAQPRQSAGAHHQQVRAGLGNVLGDHLTRIPRACDYLRGQVQAAGVGAQRGRRR